MLCASCRLLQPCNIAYLLLSVPTEDIPVHLSPDEQLAMRESRQQLAACRRIRGYIGWRGGGGLHVMSELAG